MSKIQEEQFRKDFDGWNELKKDTHTKSDNLRKFNRQMVWVLPITSRSKNPRFYERFLFNGSENFVVLTQLRTISTKRFVRKVGMISRNDFERIMERVRGSLK